MKERPPHGTVARYYQEYNRKDEKPCDACKAARREHDKALPNAAEHKKRNAMIHEINRRSRLRLSREFPYSYARIRGEETARMEEENIVKMYQEIRSEREES